MGLLSHIESIAPALPDTPERSGERQRFSSLAEFAAHHQLPHVALFSRVSDRLLMTACVGLDALTVAKSCSSVDFWNGMLTDGWNTFTKDTEPAFNQFLSAAVRTRLDRLFCARISPDAVVAILTLDAEQVTLPPIAIARGIPSTQPVETALPAVPAVFPPNTEASLFIVSYTAAIAAVLRRAGDLADTEHRALTSTISHLLYDAMRVHFPPPQVVHMQNDGAFKLVLFSAASVDESLVQCHLAHVYTAVLGDDAAAVTVMPAGKESTPEGIRVFLQER
ncbi:MAG: hypothetical protein IJ191_03470 [Treponema sp.]|nr:hypothetical protein [Treponema sp.]